ncbi:MAG: carbamoyltransferase [Rhodospirillales bacterium]|nr:carbamoyltransferase [Alphaproteobacteria bacterium]USO04182.1 MAG: carbamoyltransferase [Rhodospirillales bacterium]
MIVLGISAFYHDSAAAIIRDGDIIAAAQEERFTRLKHDAGFPKQAIGFCLEKAGVSLDEVDNIVFFEKPFAKFERLLETYLAFAPRGFQSFKTAIPLWLKEKLFQKSMLTDELAKIGSDKKALQKKLLFAEHHQSHAASAFYPSPFDEAVVLTMDGVGEWASTSVGVGKGNSLKIEKEIHFPHSLGLLYSAFTYYTGFKVNSGEYKIMGLAPYGEPKYAGLITDHLIDIKEDGSYRMDMRYFDYATGLTMTNEKFSDLFGGPARDKESEITQREMDLAASVQVVTEEVMRRMVRSLAQEYQGIDNLCLAGGVALNCVANGKILKEKAFKRIWIQPAAGDAGGALGAALAAYYLHHGNPRKTSNQTDAMKGSYLGPSFDDADIERRLNKIGAKLKRFSNDQDVLKLTAKALAEEKAVGWFQGRMEFGPRALGDRSILGDPRSPAMQKTLNLKVKYRESFRPFAPSVLREDIAEWFDLQEDSPYMLLVAPVNDNKCKEMSEEQKKLFGIEKLNIPRSDIPAVTHVDYSARVQSVHTQTNPKYHALISEFKKLTGCPVVVNTSFNVRGEPIVCTPEDAFHCFMGTEMDMLVAGNCVLYKEEQDQALAADYKDAFELD